MAFQYDTAEGDEQYFYQKDIIEEKYEIPSGKYRIVIGNNGLRNRGQLQTYIKDVRIWARKLSTLEIVKGLYSVIDPNQRQGMLAYF